MSLNTTVVSPRHIICATDRRLIDVSTGKIVTERSTKLTMLRCADALSLITYNGIGRYLDRTPADWIQELDSNVRLTSMKFGQVIEAIQQDAQGRISHMPKEIDRRHTFVFGTWGQRQPWIFVISNYESVDSEREEAKAQPTFKISVSPQAPGKETRLVITGSTQDLDPEDARTIVLVAKKAGAAGVDIKNLCVKAIQNAARRRNRKGAIGTSVLWAISERNKEVNGGLDVPGGTTVYELPNMLVPGMQMTGIYFEVPRQGKSLTWEKRWPLAESHCKKCGNPIPPGYQNCGVCGTKLS